MIMICMHLFYIYFLPLDPLAQDLVLQQAPRNLEDLDPPVTEHINSSNALIECFLLKIKMFTFSEENW